MGNRKIQINNFIKIKVDYGYLKFSHEQEKIKSILIYFKNLLRVYHELFKTVGIQVWTKQTIIPPFWAHILVKGVGEYKTK